MPRPTPVGPRGTPPDMFSSQVGDKVVVYVGSTEQRRASQQRVCPEPGRAGHPACAPLDHYMEGNV